jgi:antitoxin CptB
MTRPDPLPPLRWRSRRGLLELELLLLPFVDACVTNMTRASLQQYERMLEQDDLDIYEWLMGRGNPPEADLSEIVAQIRRFHATRTL